MYMADGSIRDLFNFGIFGSLYVSVSAGIYAITCNYM